MLCRLNKRAHQRLGEPAGVVGRLGAIFEVELECLFRQSGKYTAEGRDTARLNLDVEHVKENRTSSTSRALNENTGVSDAHGHRHRFTETNAPGEQDPLHTNEAEGAFATLDLTLVVVQ